VQFHLLLEKERAQLRDFLDREPRVHRNHRRLCFLQVFGEFSDDLNLLRFRLSFLCFRQTDHLFSPSSISDARGEGFLTKNPSPENVRVKGIDASPDRLGGLATLKGGLRPGSGRPLSSTSELH
jgi:hypothetical protein